MKMKMTENNRVVLKASAGTGKTYRLSLEFIGNLIRNVDYKDIAVMTFTKKATAEAKAFWLFLQSDEAKVAFSRYGFSPLN